MKNAMIFKDENLIILKTNNLFDGLKKCPWTKALDLTADNRQRPCADPKPVSVSVNDAVIQCRD